LALNGNVVAEAVETYPLYSPRPSWNEQDPEDWWRATVRAVRKLVKEKTIKENDIVGIGLSGQMHGSVFLDGQNRPLRTSPLVE